MRHTLSFLPSYSKIQFRRGEILLGKAYYMERWQRTHLQKERTHLQKLMIRLRHMKYKEEFFSSFSYDLLKSEILFIGCAPMLFMSNTFLTFANARHGTLKVTFKNQLIKPTKIFTHVVKTKSFWKNFLKQPDKQPNKWKRSCWL